MCRNFEDSLIFTIFGQKNNYVPRISEAGKEMKRVRVKFKVSDGTKIRGIT